MGGPAGRGRQSDGELTLFSAAPVEFVNERLGAMAWPSASRFPLNLPSRRVGDVVVADLVAGGEPLAVAGYASLTEVVEVTARWASQGAGGPLRMLVGSEPTEGQRVRLGPAVRVFSEEVADFWLARGFSLHMSAKLLLALEAARAGRLEARCLPGRARLHAKIYLGQDAVTLGSSNLTEPGLRTQLEANGRFERVGDARRYHEAEQIAENYWACGVDWTAELITLLERLLAVVDPDEALARAVAELVEGEWAEASVQQGVVPLWPTQVQGIAQALWVIDNVGSVLVADATGSGKTRMGASLIRAVRDRMWATGRGSVDLPVVVAPPGVRTHWERELLSVGMPLQVYSHGGLSAAGRGRAGGELRAEVQAVKAARVLAVDEAHNFLSSTSERTRRLLGNQADHVLLFTATPISRGGSDLLRLVNLLGADNFSDVTLEELSRLEWNKAYELPKEALDRVRREIQRFTLRRTKAQLNAAVAAAPDLYRHPRTGAVCQYPHHEARTYETGETPADEHLAIDVHDAAQDLRGLARIEERIALPGRNWFRHTAEQWLRYRLEANRGLAAHEVLIAMRSSRAAAIEHVAGTAAAMHDAGLGARTGTPLDGALTRLAAKRRPLVDLDCDIPDWLADDDQWAVAVEQERALYERILQALSGLSDAREATKAALLVRLAGQHHLVLAFERFMITLDVLHGRTRDTGCANVLVATGSNNVRHRLTRSFAAGSNERGVALCSDAMNEGLNLQGASAVVHLDLPTTVRVVEQRVGRVDRMDSPHTTIEAWWPADGPVFATRASERLLGRLEETRQLLGANLEVPDLRGLGEQLVHPQDQAADLAQVDAIDWDGLQDALAPVRGLLTGDDALIPAEVYQRYRNVSTSVLARIAPVESTSRWAFLAVRTPQGVPRWVLVEDDQVETDVAVIVDRLRVLLAGRPPGVAFDQVAQQVLSSAVAAAGAAEILLLPQRLRRALQQLRRVATTQAARATDIDIAQRWEAITALTRPDGRADVRVVAEQWMAIIADRLAEARERPRQAFVLLAHIDPGLDTSPPSLAALESRLGELPVVPRLDERVVAAIIGVPETRAGT